MSALCWDGWLPYPHSRLSPPPKRHLSLVLSVPCTFPSQLPAAPVVSGFDEELSKFVSRSGRDGLAFSSGGGGSLATISRMRQLVLGDVVVGPDSEARHAHPGATWKFLKVQWAQLLDLRPGARGPSARWGG